MKVYYNEFDPFAAEWLRQLIKAGEIPDGEVDTRSIVEVKADDIRGYTQCHFFAGIGGWPLALKLAEWDTDRPVWTGSCPCQPFSTAGRQKGKADERHLWPVWFNLIRECRPTTIFGEQVAAAITHGWLDDVYDDLEREGYACGFAVLPACSVDAAHRRERAWFVAHTPGERFQERGREQGREPSQEQRLERLRSVGNTEHNGLHTSPQSRGHGEIDERPQERGFGIEQFTGASYPGAMAYAKDSRAIGYTEPNRGKRPNNNSEVGLDWVNCPDGKARPVKPGIRLLANGVPNRVGKLRGYGNAIVPQVAAEFIKAVK